MSRLRPYARLVVVAMAALVAVAPRPALLVDSAYSRGLYPPLQRALTAGSNLVPVAVFDLVVIAALAWLAWRWTQVVRRWPKRRWLAVGDATVATATLAAGLYLWFVVAWGLNYARPPMEVRLTLPPFDVSEADVEALLDDSVRAVNAGHAAAHADQVDESAAVAEALAHVDARDGRPGPITPGRPKPTLLAPYFRMAGVDGLTAPFALETLLNPDLTPMERPFVLAHEWAHLAGQADEAEANFAAWRALAAAPSPRLRYSAWLFLLSETAGQVAGEPRRAVLQRLDDGPRADLAAIAARARDRVDVVQRVGWRVYDRYLRSQGVADGVRSYSRVVRLVVLAQYAGIAPRGPRS